MCVVAHRRTAWGEDVQARCGHIKESRGHSANASSVDLTTRLTAYRKPEEEQASARHTTQ
jgi:hypothetical protein